jgi:hypothetical protein
MSEILDLLQEANKRFNSVDHMLYVTYPLVKDNKLLILMVEGLNKSLNLFLEALMNYEYLYKRINNIPEDFSGKMDLLKRSVANRYNIPRNSIVVMEDLNKIVDERRKSPMEIVKREKYVILSDNYNQTHVTIEKLKNYINESKLFINKVNTLIENARRFSTL